MENKKPLNVFGVWYPELCRRSRLKPCSLVKTNPSGSTLHFLTDGVNIDEWHPILCALRHDMHLHAITIVSRIGTWIFLHDVDTEEKFQLMSRRTGTLWTTYTMKSLLRSLGRILRSSEALNFLELDGIPMFMEYLEVFTMSLSKNRSLRILSLARSRILDAGCKHLCDTLKHTPNIEVLDLTGCGLTIKSAEYLTKLIKYQQIDRCCEGWQNSLRYSNPKIHLMRGIKRLTLNDNPFLGDDGFEIISDALFDDLWIKAVDLQQCGLTEDISPKMFELVKCNDSLQILDVRENYGITKSTLEKVFDILKSKQSTSGEQEFQWYDMTFRSDASESGSNFKYPQTVLRKSVRKVQSAPLLKLRSKMSIKSSE